MHLNSYITFFYGNQINIRNLEGLDTFIKKKKKIKSFFFIPQIGVSPILPLYFPVIPPVDVPDATCPFLSTTTQPTVPLLPSVL